MIIELHQLNNLFNSSIIVPPNNITTTLPLPIKENNHNTTLESQKIYGIASITLQVSSLLLHQGNNIAPKYKATSHQVSHLNQLSIRLDMNLHNHHISINTLLLSTVAVNNKMKEGCHLKTTMKLEHLKELIINDTQLQLIITLTTEQIIILTVVITEQLPSSKSQLK